MVKGVGHLGRDEAMEAGGREFDHLPGNYSRRIGNYYYYQLSVFITNVRFVRQANLSYQAF